MQDLGTEQRARIERLARGKGITCRTCGSAELRSDGRAHPYVGKGFGVDLWCTNADAHLQTIPAWEQDNPSSYPRKRRVRQVLSLQAEETIPVRTRKVLRRAHSAACGGVGLRESGDPRKGKMHPHLAREATVRDVQTKRYGRDYAGRRGKITHVDKDPQTGAATGYVIRMEDGGNKVRFESEEIRIMEDWD